MRANLTCLLLVSCIVVVVSAYFKSASPQNVVASKLFRWRRFGRSVRKWGYKRGIYIIYVANVLNTILVIHCTANNARGRRDLDRMLVGLYNYLCNQYLVPLML